MALDASCPSQSPFPCPRASFCPSNPYLPIQASAREFGAAAGLPREARQARVTALTARTWHVQALHGDCGGSFQRTLAAIAQAELANRLRFERGWRLGALRVLAG